jgi:hypothetical protein
MLAPFVDPHQPSGQDVRAALDRICCSGSFCQAPKLTLFLRFVVEMTLAGQGDRLKGYTIGVEALGRAESFNPQIDPIVRVEAIRLRAALERYYAGPGARDPLLIEMPRGRYVARFRWRAPDRWPARNLVDAVRKLQRVLGMRLVLQRPPDPS